MLRGIFSVLRRMMAGLVGLCGYCLSMPGRLLGFGPLIEAPALPDLNALRDPPASGMTAAEVAHSRLRDSRNAFSFATESVLDGIKPALPRVSKGTREWLRGLTYGELEKLAEAGPNGVSAHLQGLLIDGVRQVQPLPDAPLVVPPVEVFDPAAYEDADLAPAQRQPAGA